MRKIITTTWISLDGFIAGPNEANPNEAMDWVMVDQDMGQYEDEIVSAADTLLLGRVTYESFAGSWPHVPDNPDVSEGEREYARKLNAMRKVVFSTTLPSADWNNSTLLREIAPAEIEKMKQEPGRDLLIYGSASVVRALTNHGLIDEYQLLVHPVILGAGKPLFQDIKARRQLELVKTKPFSSGVIGLYYRPGGK
jgi:dihydrofolate reductase